MRVLLAAIIVALIASASYAGWREDSIAKARAAGGFSSGGGTVSSALSAPAPPDSSACLFGSALFPCDF